MMTKAKPKIATMAELSKAIGVSRPTLSRYFQDPNAVRATTASKIKERLAEVDYVYNFMATRQNRKASGLIGVIVPLYSDLFFASLLEAIKGAVQGTGYTVITQSSDGHTGGEIEAIGRLRSLGADGAIVAPLGHDASSEAFDLASRDFPIVFVDSHPATAVQGADFVGTNNERSIATIVDYLCRTGDAPIYLDMPAVNSNAVERRNAYAAKMKALGLQPRYVAVDPAETSWQFEAYGLAVMDAHFGRQHYVDDTILCANDRIAIGAISAANKHALFNPGVPRQGRLRIAGHDDHPLSRFMFPAITTAGQDIAGIGQEAVRLLLDRIRGERTGASVEVRKEALLVVRSSA